MKFELFKQLYSEALEYDTSEMFTEERGWQDWMEDHTPSVMLPEIYSLANSELKETRERLKISRAAFSRFYSIPIRTLEDWDAGKSELKTYQKLLLDYSLFMR